MVDAASIHLDDLAVFEIRYADRVGENYFARHSPRHRWWCYREILSAAHARRAPYISLYLHIAPYISLGATIRSSRETRRC